MSHLATPGVGPQDRNNPRTNHENDTLRTPGQNISARIPWISRPRLSNVSAVQGFYTPSMLSVSRAWPHLVSISRKEFSSHALRTNSHESQVIGELLT